jgi:hypothetical protein
LQNKSPLGKVDEIFGPTTELMFTVKCTDGVKADSFKAGDKLYISPDKLLPMARFVSPSCVAEGVCSRRRVWCVPPILSPSFPLLNPPNSAGPTRGPPGAAVRVAGSVAGLAVATAGVSAGASGAARAAAGSVVGPAEDAAAASVGVRAAAASVGASAAGASRFAACRG